MIKSLKRKIFGKSILDVYREQSLDRMDRIDRLSNKINTLSDHNDNILEKYQDKIHDLNINPVIIEDEEYESLRENMIRLDSLRGELFQKDGSFELPASKRKLQYIGASGIKDVVPKGSQTHNMEVL